MLTELKKVTTAQAISTLSNTQIKELQEALNLIGFDLDVDGIVGPKTMNAFNQFKKDAYLDHPDIIGRFTIDKLEGKISASQGIKSRFKFCYPPINQGGKQMIVQIPNGWIQKALSETDCRKLAQEYNVPYPSIRAVMEVEASGSGFILSEPSPARPKILFEGHWFYKLTPEPVSKTRPDLSYPSWTKKHYIGGIKEWDVRLLDAMKFDYVNALRSASWGLGQVMGFNHLSAGCKTIEQFVIEAHMGEYEQARHMFNFCKNHPSGILIRSLQTQDWVNFARLYNGPGFAKNQYDKKLAQAFRKWS